MGHDMLCYEVEQFTKAHAELKHFKMSRKHLIDKPVNLDNNRRRPNNEFPCSEYYAENKEKFHCLRILVI
ncbi:hypothetical protein T07_10106 [Trichinella nelsoni]|uniref:Uncharacterized protein n=1 Tax=Trichinella nelsoni TaxID=6336 RepID=A0A0V0SED1_9BILA|nr:hypothetical protein T07_10106 [Trichinella nelsoni]